MAKAGLCLLMVSVVWLTHSAVITRFEVDVEWPKFKQIHKKEYSSEQEERYRRDVFEETLKKIQAHNEAYERGEEKWTQEITSLADMTDSEFLDSIRCKTCNRGTSKPTGSHIDRLKRYDINDINLDDLEDPPETQDWKSKGKLTSPRNQYSYTYGDCGSCYAFSAAGAMESSYAIEENLVNTVDSQRPIVKFSVQELLDCGYAYGNHGCAGGHEFYAYKTVKRLGGITNNTEYYYIGPGKPDSILKVRRRFHNQTDCKKTVIDENKVATVDNAWLYQEGTATKLKKLVGNKGPTNAGVCVNADWRNYGSKSGTYYATRIKCPRSSDACNLKHGTDWHGVLVYGYTKDAWLVQNSWGIQWGNQGTMKLSRSGDEDGGVCGVATEQTIPFMKKL